jgi:hypothetical protein
MENISENTQKPKRGRPKSIHRLVADSGLQHGCARTKFNFSLCATFMGILSGGTTEQQVKAIGCTYAELSWKYGGNLFPGAITTGAEVTRYLDAVGDTAENRSAILECIVELRDMKMSWSAVRDYFRSLRIGRKQGDALSLFTHLARAFDEYCARFPATSHKMKIAGIRNLLDAVEEEGE